MGTALGLAMTFRMGSRHWDFASGSPLGLVQNPSGPLGVGPGISQEHLGDSCVIPWGLQTPEPGSAPHVTDGQPDAWGQDCRKSVQLWNPGLQTSRPPG